MSAYLARLKQLENGKNSHYVPKSEPTKPTKGAFDGFDGTGTGHIEKKIIDMESEGAHFLWMVKSKNGGSFRVATSPPSTLAEILRDFPDTDTATPLLENERANNGNETKEG